MLYLMRKHAGSWLIKIILFAIVVVFVFWGVGSMRSRQATRVAEINGEYITLEVYRQAYYQLLDNYRRVYGDQLNDDMLKLLRPNEMALDQLVQRVLMLQEADRLDIDVSEQELVSAIRQVPAFQNNGAFDYSLYRRVLSQNNLTVEQFEIDRSKEMRLDKLRTALLGGVTVSDDEVRQWYNWNKATVDLDYVQFSASRYTDISPADTAVKEYFDANQKNYLTEPKVNVRYIKFDPADFESQVRITDEGIADYYHSNPEEFKTQKRVKASHILIKLDAGADDDTVAAKKEEALKIVASAKAAGANFAELAKQYSQGPSRDQGGQLGWFTRDRMVKPFADKAFAMTVGQISEPVRTQFGWHIIKVEQIEEAATQSLDAATEIIRQKITTDKSRSLAMDKAEEVYNSVFDGDNLADAAKAHDVVAETTGFFTAENPGLKGIAQIQKFTQASFGLDLMAISEIKDFGDGFYLLQVIERAEPAVPEYTLVMQKVKTDLVKERQDDQARKDAEAFLAAVKEGASFDAVSKQYNVTPKETGFFSRGGAIPQIGYESQISQSAFELSKEKPLPESALKGRQGWYVVQFKSRQLPKGDGFEKEKATISKGLEDQKKQAALQSWLADLRARSVVAVNRELIQP
jgi:peptidyl-prolyl cis-trans isomerase D